MDKFALNKTLLVLAFCLLCSCFADYEETATAEIICQDLGIKVFIHNTTARDFWEALDKFHQARMARGSKENYTVIALPNGHSMQFKASTEDMMKCFARDVRWSAVHKDYRML